MQPRPQNLEHVSIHAFAIPKNTEIQDSYLPTISLPVALQQTLV